MDDDAVPELELGGVQGFDTDIFVSFPGPLSGISYDSLVVLRVYKGLG